jgi:hypothetical protein
MSAAALLTAGSAWRVTGLAAAGRALVGILLTRAGDRSVPLIRDALAAGADPADLVDILGSIGTEAAQAALGTAAGSSRADVAAAARRALHTLEQMRRKPD